MNGSPASSRRSLARAERGMVTAEIAVGLVTLALVVALAIQVVDLVMLQTRCSDVAAAVARQLARGDAAAAAEAENTRPAGARIEVQRSSDAVVVTVRLERRIGPLSGVGTIPLGARATVLAEPGAQP